MRLAQVALTSLMLLCHACLCVAAPPVLGLPLQCPAGTDCPIQNYVDHDTGPGWRDHACGTLSYDGHTGTDFRVADLVAMKAGVNVLAAAAGTVVAIRDGEPDTSVRQRGRSALAGKDAGNSVRLRHPDGWETQYSHLKQGSVAVRAGQLVAAGEVLGQIGLSGNTEFPHVDFTVRHLGKTVDPFAPRAGLSVTPYACGTLTHTLWDPALATVLKYRPSGLLTAGFAAETPQRDRAEAGANQAIELTPASPMIVFWQSMFGLQKGDVVEMQLSKPNGQALAHSRTVAEGNKAVWFALLGKRRTAAWPTGQYLGRVLLRRGEQVVFDETRRINVD
jgi:murein DD-endopeptidase MepM/ murein hydrolase activator NlpD